MKPSLVGYYLLFALIGTVTVSCNRVKPEAPQATTLDSTLAIPSSVINVPVHFEIKELEKTLNSKIQGTFVHDTFKINNKSDSLYLEIEKQGPIKLARKERTIYYSVPLRVAGIPTRIGGIRIKNVKPVETELIIDLATSLSLDQQWNLKLQTAIQKITWVRDPVLKLGVVKINLRKTIEEALEKNKDKLIPKMDEALSNLVNTRKIGSKLWQDIQKPIRVNKKGKQVWLKVYATDMTARLADTSPELITLDVQLLARVETLFEGDSIPPSNAVLPPFRQKKTENDSLKIFVLVKIPFQSVNDVLNEQLSGKELAAEGYSATIKKLEVYGTEQGLAFRIKLQGDVNGQLYATAMPAYDSLRSTIYAKNFAFDIDSENTLINSADWLLHEHALDLIHDKLSVNVSSYIQLLPKLIIGGIEKGKVGEKIDLKMNSLSIHPLYGIVTCKNFQILFQADGKADIGLEQKLFAGKGKPRKK